ncbi:MAG: sensor histidine kinase [Acidimicrobiales bacterium]|jgi:two-component system OmpR family sensor kinase|nr:HAMP domain-containing histidine kinase [Actinomycetota bacterium]
MSLRRRLVLTVSVLVVVGLAVADVISYFELKAFLYGRLDEQIAVAQHQALRYLTFINKTGRPISSKAFESRISPDVYVILFSNSGKVLLEDASGPPDNPDPRPVLPANVRIEKSPGREVFGRRYGVYTPSSFGFTSGSYSRSGISYRSAALSVPQGTLVTSISLNPTIDTLNVVLRVELASSALIVLALIAIALWTIRAGLRPLDEITKTADEIARGDLSGRVSVSQPETEVGRLGDAFNTMVKRLEALFEDKSLSEVRLRQFIADASHELRTPLTSIRGYAELLKKGAYEDPESRDRVYTRVEHEARRMSGLVDDLLLLARLDQGRSLRHVEVNLTELSNDVVNDILSVSGPANVEVVSTEPVVVIGDPDRLSQVVHNLVGNAVQHTREGTRVEVDVSRNATMGVLNVTDYGRGIPRNSLDRVFDRFYQGDSSRTGSGTGLGLSIVRAIAEALGGNASVDLPPEGGTRFTVEIPLARR